MGETASVQSDAPGGDGERSVGDQAAAGFLWANLSVIVRYGLSMLVIVLIARILDPVRYPGEFAGLTIVMLVATYLDTVLNLGVGAAVVHDQERGVTRRVRVAFTANLGLALVLAVAAVAGAPLLAAFFKLHGQTEALRLLGLVVFLSGLVQVPWALFMRDLRFKARAMVEVSRDVARFVVTIVVAAVWHRGAWAGVLGLVAAYSVAMVLTWALLRFVPRLAWDRGTARELVAYAWKMAANRLLGLLALNGDYLVVGRMANASLPFYQTAFRIPEVVLAGQLTAVSDVLFPTFSRLRSEGMAAMSAAMLRALRLLAILAFPLGALMALGARDAVTVLFGATFAPAIPVMELIAVAGCSASLGFATGDLLFAMDRGKVMVLLNLVMVPTMLASMYLVLRAGWGIEAVAGVHAVNAAVFFVIRQSVVNRIVGVRWSQVLLALRPGVVLALGTVAVGLPARLTTSSAGVVPGLMVLAAAAVGAALSCLLWREALNEATALVRRVVRR